jgi:hypothetical protein
VSQDNFFCGKSLIPLRRNFLAFFIVLLKLAKNPLFEARYNFAAGGAPTPFSVLLEEFDEYSA